MSTVQKQLPFDCTSNANYLAWSKNGISAALTTLGWTAASDSYAVTWANVVSGLTPLNSIPRPLVLTAAGAWSGGTSYAGVQTNGGTNAMVTSGGLTYLCVANTQLTLTQVIQSAATSNTTTAVATASTNGTTAYTWSVAGGAANAYVGYVFTVTGYANANNNGTFVCTASSAVTLTLSNPNGVSITANGTAASVTTSSAVVFSSNAICAGNSMAGQSFVIGGFAASAGANNGTFTATASSALYIGYSNSSGVNETHAGTATTNTAPASSLLAYASWSGSQGPVGGFWILYNYEMWVSNGALSASSPIYLKLVYGCLGTVASSLAPELTVAVGTGSNGAGTVTGNYFDPSNNGYPEYGFGPGSTTNSSVLYECDFSGDADNFRMILWRTAGTTNVCALAIERGRDQHGNGLAGYWTCCEISNTGVNGLQQSVFAPTAGTIAGYSTNGFSCPHFTGSGHTAHTGNANGQVPPLPIFPIVGFVGNPLLGLVCFKDSDVVEGSFVNVVFFGTSYTYLVTKATGVNDALQEADGAVGILWS